MSAMPQQAQFERATPLTYAPRSRAREEGALVRGA